MTYVGWPYGPSHASAAWGDQARFVGEDHGLDAVAKAQFREDAGDVGLHRRLAEEEVGRDLGVRHAAREHAEDFEFPGGQRGQVTARTAGGSSARGRRGLRGHRGWR